MRPLALTALLFALTATAAHADLSLQPALSVAAEEGSDNSGTGTPATDNAGTGSQASTASPS
ncbi:MAG: hypothetical protein AAGC84_00030 [Pseudomonas sp.]